jgi:NAD-dependent deacetylase
MRKIVVLTGAGVSAESGIKTFRDADGLWEGHDVMAVASPEGWLRDKELVLDFYNQRRRQLLTVEPNPAHHAIKKLEEKFDVHIITQNIDNLHERAGSSKVVHLHGELIKARSSLDETLLYHWPGDITIGDTCDRGSQLRPHVVWFGEPVPAMEQAIRTISDADYIMIVGTSMVVYPAASLIMYAPPQSKVFYVDPKPNISYELSSKKDLKVIPKPAGEALPELVDQFLSNEYP